MCVSGVYNVMTSDLITSFTIILYTCEWVEEETKLGSCEFTFWKAEDEYSCKVVVVK